jgi:nucleoside-diphosphate-sugar epimerase
MILVTGGTGMLGSFIVSELQRRGLAVRVLARPHSLETARKLGVEVCPGDLDNPESLRQAMKGIAGIIHAACTMSDEEIDIDIAAMRTLLENWGEGSFVYISSVDVYGYPNWVPVTETHPLQPTSSYGQGKVVCERLLQEAAVLKNRADYTILRPPHIWGPHPQTLQWIAVQRVFQGLSVVLPGATEAEWSQFGDDWIDARDLAWVAVECLDISLGEAVNTINSHFIWHDFYAEMIRLTGSASRIEHKELDAIANEELPNKVFYAQTWRYSGDRLKDRMGFHSSRRWSDTLAAIIAGGRRGK